MAVMFGATPAGLWRLGARHAVCVRTPMADESLPMKRKKGRPHKAQISPKIRSRNATLGKIKRFSLLDPPRHPARALYRRHKIKQLYIISLNWDIDRPNNEVLKTVV
jgi:hypothetical protein